MKLIIILILIWFIKCDIFSQNQELEFIYSVKFENSLECKNVTDSIVFIYKTKSWFLQKSQKEVDFIYLTDENSVEAYFENHPLSAERERFIKNRKKREQGKKGWDNYTVYDSLETTGYVDNDSIFWTHSPRNNQFAKCQVAPLIEVKKKELQINASWHSRIPIYKGFPNNKEFIGTLECVYEVLSKKDIIFGDKITECWEIKATGTHDNLGISTTTFCYNEAIGILEVLYEFYDESSIKLLILDTSNL